MNIMSHWSRQSRVATRVALAGALIATGMVSRSASAQASTSAGVRQQPAAATTNARPAGPDLQGLWDFTMRAGDRLSPGFFALGPLGEAWGGSITMYLTNTLAIRSLTVSGDSVTMVVASLEGDVRYKARLSDNARTMTGIVEYHGGALLPMVATRRSQPAVPR